MKQEKFTKEEIRQISVPSNYSLYRKSNAKEVEIELAYHNFSDGELKKLKKMVLTGVIHGSTPITKLAQNIRLKLRLPALLVNRGFEKWCNLMCSDEGLDPIRRYIATAKVLASSLAHEPPRNNNYKLNYVAQELEKRIESEKSGRQVSISLFVVAGLKDFVLSLDFGAPPFLHEYMDKVVNRKVKTEKIFVRLF